MSSISPGSMSDAYYNGVLSDMHRANQEQIDQNETEVRRLREAHQEDLANLEAKQERSLASIEEKNAEAIEAARRSAVETVNENRRMLEAEVDRVKGQVYDRYGRYNSRVTDEEFKNAKDAWEAQNEANQRSMRGLEDSRRRAIEESSSRHAEELESVAREVKAAAMKAYDSDKEIAKRDDLDQKLDLQARYAEFARNLAQDTEIQNRAALQSLDEQKKDFEHQKDQLKQSSQQSLEKLAEEQNKRSDTAIRSMRQSYKRQADLNQKEKQALLGTSTAYLKTHSDGRAEAFRELETENMVNLKRLQSTHEGEMQKARENAKDQEIYLGKLQQDSIEDKEKQYGKLIQKINQDNYERMRELQKNFEKAESQHDIQTSKERKLSSEQRERQMANATEDRNRALNAQAQAGQETLSNQRQNYETQIKNLELKLSRLKTGEDDSVPAAAEEAARRVLTKHYDKLLKEEFNRDRRATESLQREYQGRLSDLKEDTDYSKRMQNLKTTTELDLERSKFTNFAADLKAEKDETIRKKDWEVDRMQERMNRTFSKNLTDQRRQMTEVAENLRSTADARTHQIKSEAQQDQMIRHREHNLKQTELVANYERALSNQKEDHQDAMRLLKQETDRRIREAERTLRDTLEAQQKNHAAELRQLELKGEERQRAITQNYEEEFDRMRRANARALQKKG